MNKNTSPYYDKFIVLRDDSFEEDYYNVCHEELELSDKHMGHDALQELARIVHAVLRKVIARRKKRYYCLPLPNKASDVAIELFLIEGQGKTKTEAKKIVRTIHKPHLDERCVFKYKAIMSGIVTEQWVHDDGTSVYDVRTNDGKVISVPEAWVVKFVKEDEEE